MKRIVAVLLAALMLVASVAVLAESTNAMVVFQTAAGSKVTLEMKGEYDLEFDEHSEGDYVQFNVVREGVAPVTVIIAAVEDDTCYTLNDLDEETLEAWRASLAETEENCTGCTVEVTAAGNKYFKLTYAYEDGTEGVERFTVFQGFDMSRYQEREGGPLTEADIAFMDEVQQGMWVEEVASEAK